MQKLIIIIAILTLFPAIAQAQVLINEVAWMGTAASANAEWLELYNTGDTDIDLTGWNLNAADGAPAVKLSGAIAAGQYFLLERTSDATVPGVTADLIYTGALGNAGEWLKLTDSAGSLVDEVNATAGWPAGDNTTKQTMERVGQATWQTSAAALGTPKAANSAQAPVETTPDATTDNSDEDSQATSTDQLAEPSVDQPEPANSSNSQTYPKAKKGDFIITEVFPNPVGPDTDSEFVEIKNVSLGMLDITGWKLTNAAKQEFIFPSLVLPNGKIMTFYRHQTGLALNNTKDKITLYSSSGLIINQADYKDAPANLSWQIDEAKKYRWATPTPDEENNLPELILPTAVIQGPTSTPVGDIVTFDASDSFDPKNRPLGFLWDFGQRQTTGSVGRNIYFESGTYQVKLTAIVNATTSASTTFKLKVIGNSVTTTTSTSSDLVVPNYTINLPYILISEILPSPTGSDATDEFIELFNQENYAVDLTGWQLTDGAKTFTFEPMLIKPQQYLALFRPQTKLTLNNAADQITLLAPDGRIVDQADYRDANTGMSFVLDERFDWQQTDTPTPGEINVLNAVTEPATTAPTSTPTGKVLGASMTSAAPTKPNNNNRLLIAGAMGIAALGLGVFLKRKKIGA